MDRLEFAKSIKYDIDPNYTLLYKFDELMVLFDLVNYNNSILDIATDSSSITGQVIFNITVSDKTTCNKICTVLSNQRINRYGNVFLIKAYQNDTTLIVQLINMSSG